MPAIIRSININSSSGTVNFGGALNLSPKNFTKTFAGSGISSTGNIVITNNGISFTNTVDPNVVDQVQVGGG